MMPDRTWRPRPQPLGRFYAVPVAVAAALPTVALWRSGWLDDIVNANLDVLILGCYAVALVAAPFVLVWSAVKR